MLFTGTQKYKDNGRSTTIFRRKNTNRDKLDIRKGTGSSVLYNIKEDDIREGNGSSVTCNISGNKIRKGNGSSGIMNVRGDKICKGTGSSALYNSTDGMNNEEIAAVLYALGEIRA